MQHETVYVRAHLTIVASATRQHTLHVRQGSGLGLSNDLRSRGDERSALNCTVTCDLIRPAREAVRLETTRRPVKSCKTAQIAFQFAAAGIACLNS